MMEAIERYSAQHFKRTDARGTFREVCQDADAMDPQLLQRYSWVSFAGDCVFDWVSGTDLP